MSGGNDADDDTAVKAAIMSAITGASSLDISASSGSGMVVDLLNDTVGALGNVAITEILANAPTATLTPVGMSSGVDASTNTQVKTALLSAINGATDGTFTISATSGSGMLINLANSVLGVGGNIGMGSTLANAPTATLTLVGMSNGIDPSTNAQVKAAIISAITGVGGTLDISASAGGGLVVNLVNDVKGTLGNHAITTTLANTPTATLTPVGMSSGSDGSNAGAVATAIMNAINGSPLDITASITSSPRVDLVANNYGLIYNNAITETIAQGPTITLLPTGMLGGTDPADDATIKSSIISAIFGAPVLNITPSSGSAMLINLVNDLGGTAGNIPIVESMTYATLTPTGMLGGLDMTAEVVIVGV
jgi:hypothetical protein